MRYGLSPSEGIKVIISQPMDMPEILSSHFLVGNINIKILNIKYFFLFIAPNRETNLAMSVKDIKRQGPPYPSSCSSSYPSELDLEKNPHNHKYSENRCKRLCFLSFVEEKCNCTDPLLLEADESYDFPSINFCPTMKTDTQRICVDKYINNHSEFACLCRPECDTLQFQVSKPQIGDALGTH